MIKNASPILIALQKAMSRAIKQVEGKRLEYRESVDNPPYRPAVVGQPRAPFEG